MEQSFSNQNPNKARNRIPLASEREILRFALNIKRNKQSSLDDEIESVKEKRKAVEMHRQRLQEELEADKSAIFSLDECIANAMAQKTSLLPSINELEGLLHPIRSCPDDILGEILQNVVKSSPSYAFDSVSSVTKLSHVCQRWRKITLDTPSLWSNISIQLPVDSKDRRNEILPQLLWSIQPRLKRHPVDISIYGGHMDVGAFRFAPLSCLYNLNLKRISLFVHPTIGIDIVKQLSCSVDYLSVSATSPGLCDLDVFMSCTNSLNLFVGDRAWTAPNLRQYDNIKSLTLHLLGSFSVSNILKSCLKLESLTIHDDVEDLTTESTACTFPNLRNLKAPIGVIQNTLLHSLSICPKLEEVKLVGQFNTQVIQFLRRHPWIRFMAVSCQEDLLTAIELFPKLTGLRLAPSLSKIIHSWEEYGLDKCPFPAMAELKFEWDGDELSQGDIKSILDRRTHGPGFELLRAQGVVPLRVLKIRRFSESDMSWLKIPSLRLATVIREQPYPDRPMYIVRFP